MRCGCLLELVPLFLRKTKGYPLQTLNSQSVISTVTSVPKNQGSLYHLVFPFLELETAHFDTFHKVWDMCEVVLPCFHSGESGPHRQRAKTADTLVQGYLPVDNFPIWRSSQPSERVLGVQRVNRLTQREPANFMKRFGTPPDGWSLFGFLSNRYPEELCAQDCIVICYWGVCN